SPCSQYSHVSCTDMTTTAPGRDTGRIAVPDPAISAARTRMPLWDNARFAIIVLVVMGHAIQRQIYDSQNALSLYLFFYAFHMPALMFVSGYFSRAEPLNTSRMRRIVSDLVVPYLI